MHWMLWQVPCFEEVKHKICEYVYLVTMKWRINLNTHKAVMQCNIFDIFWIIVTSMVTFQYLMNLNCIEETETISKDWS